MGVACSYSVILYKDVLEYLTLRRGCEIHFFKSLRPNAVVVWFITQNKDDFSAPLVCEQEKCEYLRD